MSTTPCNEAAKKPLNVHEAAKAGSQALANGHVADAKAIFLEIRQDQPDHPAWRTGLAHVAISEKDPAEALRLLDESGPVPPPVTAAWTPPRGKALGMLGRLDEAEYVYRQGLDRFPDSIGIRWGLAGLLNQTRRPAEALAVIDAGGKTFTDHPGIFQIRISVYLALGRMAEADELLQAAIGTASSPIALERIFRWLPRVYGESDRWREKCQALRCRLDALSANGQCATNESALPVLLRYALGEMEAFIEETEALLQTGYSGPFATALSHVAKALRQPNRTATKVFVIGLSKTGTTTMDAALSRLGFSAYHNHHPLTLQQLCEEDAELFDALSDIPIAHIFESLAKRYPNARFILTRRAEEDWLKSLTNHLRRSWKTESFEMLRDRVADPNLCPGGLLWRQITKNIYTKHSDFLTAYRAHEARVREFFQNQPGRLLEFDLFSGDGWTQLCEFLDLPVPDEAFPWENASPLRRVGK